MPDITEVHDGWSLAALIVVVVGLALGGPALRKWLAPDDSASAAHEPGDDALSMDMARLLVDSDGRFRALELRLAALEAEHGVVKRDLEDVVDALSSVIAWLDAGSPHPPPVISDAVRAILARRTGGSP